MKKIPVILLVAFLTTLSCSISAFSDTYWDDPTPPVFVSASIDRSTATVGDTVKLTWEITDADGIDSVMPLLLEPDGGVMGVSSATPNGPANEIDFRVISTWEPGTYKVIGFDVTDKAGYSTTIWDSSYAAAEGKKGPTANLSNLVFDVIDPIFVPKYSVVEGDNTTYSKGSGGTITIRFDGPFDKFMLLEVDGSVVDIENYSVKRGSTIITLNQKYLDSLSNGRHEATAYYTDGGRATAYFVVEDSDKTDPHLTDTDSQDSSTIDTSFPPKTGDNLDITTCALAALALLGLLVSKKKRFRIF